MTAEATTVGARAHTASRVGVGTANGTFGELLQGALPGPGAADGEGRFLVTLPVARWSSARFEVGAPGTGLTVTPATRTKAHTLAAALLAELGHPADGRLVLRSNIPEGKGMASSSADLVATARAVAAVVGRAVPAHRLGALLAAVEPTDGVMHPGIVAFDHRRGVHLRTLGRLPGLQIVAVDQGGRLDTVAFNLRTAGYGAPQRRQYARLLDELERAVACQDLPAVGRIATLSAELNQERVPNRNLAALRRISESVGGLGVVACHSGTMVGMLLDPGTPGYRERLSWAVHMTEDLPGRSFLYRTLDRWGPVPGRPPIHGTAGRWSGAPSVGIMTTTVPSAAATRSVPTGWRAPLDLVRDRARRTGDAIAVDDPVAGTTLTYRALVEQADRLAGALRRHGVGPEVPVAVLLERSADAVVAMLAVAAAGGVYCPLDTASPPLRTRAVADRLGAAVAIAGPDAADSLPAGTVVLGPGATGPVAPACRPDPDALAYVMHTSGSTGMPKGVAMTHRGLERLIRHQVRDGEPGLRTLQFTAPSFDVTFQEVLSTLVTGGCLVVAAEAERRNPFALLDTIVTQRIERLFLPYVALQLLAVAADREGVVPESLRHVVTAGERLIVTPPLRALFAVLPGCRLDNQYGPTEAHLVTRETLPVDRASWPDRPPIGGPVSEVGTVVLDEQLRPVPAGVVGELYVGGPGLARGYLDQPALTAERFTANPDGSGARLYRTGDLVRAGRGGTLEFIGRADAQIKVRGFRVEPAEVENALLTHPDIGAASVGLRAAEGASDGVPVLVGYLQTRRPVPHRELTAHLRARLPGYMVPSRFVTLDTLPRTASGKVDPRALAALTLTLDPGPAGPADPAAEGGSVALPEVITAIWRRVLGHDDFEPDDDFFDVGGDSLLATWVVAELGQVLGEPVALSTLLESSTVDELATVLAQDGRTAVGGGSPSEIVTLCAGPAGRSVYVVHPLGGELLGYRELARAVSAPVRLLGVGWRGGPPPAGATLAEIAAVHVDQLRTVQPEGGFLLLGWSFGGVLAFEIARQLAAAGVGVDLVGLLDANPVLDPITGLPLAQTPFRDLLDTVLESLADPDVTGSELTELTSTEVWVQLMGAPLAAGSSRDYLRGVLSTARACMDAAMRYEPEPYAGTVHSFVATASGAARAERLTAALRGICTGTLTVTPVPGDHWGAVRGDGVAGTAAALDAVLENPDFRC